MSEGFGRARRVPVGDTFSWLVIALGFALAVSLFVLAAVEWREFRLPDNQGVDLAFFNQTFYLGVHDLGRLHTTVQDTLFRDAQEFPTGLASHFSPVFYLVLPLYAFWQSPLMLLVLSALAVAACGVVIAFTARRLFDSRIAGLVWFGVFALFPPVLSSTNVNTFREVFIAAVFLSLALFYYLEDNDRLFVLMLIPAILSKEDIALLLPVWGVVAGLSRGRWCLAGGLIVAGIGYFLAANMIVLPLLRGAPVGTIYFAGYNPTRPLTLWGAVHSVFGRSNVHYWATIFGPLLFLPLLGWEYAVIAAYVYGEISLIPMLQQEPLRYVFPAVPFIFVAAMAGTLRVVRLAEWALRRSAAAAAVRKAVPVVVLCAVAAGTLAATNLPAILRQNAAAGAAIGGDRRLLRELAGIPPRASLAATDSLIAQAPSRRVLYFVAWQGANWRRIMDRSPDYIALDLSDFVQDSPRAVRALASVLCSGVYGVDHSDRVGAGRIVLERGAGLSANGRVYEAYRESLHLPRRPCPLPRHVIDPDVFARAAGIHAHARVPSVIPANEMFAEPVVARSRTRFTQVIHLPDQTFRPGRYQVDLLGVWWWPWAPARYRMSAQVLVGERVVGEAAAVGGRPLRYATPPFLVRRRETLPIRVKADLRIPTEEALALEPARGRCAIVADAPSLNVQDVTVEAWIFAETLPRPRVGTESEAPIVGKNDAPGYYLRLVRDDHGEVWADFSVAGKWSLGRAGPVPLRRWTALAATYDGHEARLFINGAPASQIPSRSPEYAGVIRSQGAPLAIGCRDPGQPEEVAFPGLIASARVWNRVLAPREIRDGAAMGALPTVGLHGLVGAWGFQGVQGDTLPDLSGAGNPIVNAGRLARVPARNLTQPFAAWRSRELGVLRLVTIRPVNH